MYGRIGASFDVHYSGEADEANQSGAAGQTDAGGQRFANMFARMHLAGVVLPAAHLRRKWTKNGAGEWQRENKPPLCLCKTEDSECGVMRSRASLGRSWAAAGVYFGRATPSWVLRPHAMRHLGDCTYGPKP